MKNVIMGIVVAIFATSDLSAQWTTSGSNIYNSNTGNVGIGLSTPLEKLNILDGNILVSSDNFALNTIMGTVKICHTIYPNAYAGMAASTNGGGLDQLDLLFYTAYGGATEKMRIMSLTGYVGIGISAPLAKLHIKSTGITNSTTSLLIQNSAGTDLLKLYDNGFMGIGTTATATEKLHIQNGNLRISSYSNTLNTIMGAVKISQTGYPSAYVGIAGMTNGIAVDQVDLLFYTASGSATEKMRIMSNSGNVLIGKISQTNSSYKLDVNGNARMNKVVVNTTGADFVFDPAYHLLPLDSLNTFIQKNHHLPDIPSADEMQREGLDVGDNQIKLLQKIEELTLIVIEQNKRIESLEKVSKSK